MLDIMFQHPARFSVHAYLYARLIFKKETTFPLLDDQATYISIHNQFSFIPQRARIFKGIFEDVLDVPTY